MMVHSEKKSFQCSQCQSKFKLKENLVRHIVTSHGLPKEVVLSAITASKSIVGSLAHKVSDDSLHENLQQEDITRPSASVEMDDSQAVV